MKYDYSFLVFLVISMINNSLAQSTQDYLFTRKIQDSLLASSEMDLHVAAWNYSFIGEYRKALEAFDQAQGEPSFEEIRPPLKNKRLTFRPAVEYIVQRSLKERIIVINEAHHQPLHRVFTESLLEGLYQNGFRYLGLETLAEDSLINLRQWPLMEDGYYSREPQFAAMIRKALRLGFTVFKYEAEGNGSVREKGQARTIHQLLKKDPKAKMLLHCGFDHVREGKVPEWGKAMAGELKALSGIDPFTIDQVALTEHSQPGYESSDYPTESLAVASLALDRQGHIKGNQANGTDVRIIHPRTRFINRRPHWLLRNGSWKIVSLEKIAYRVDFPCRVSVHDPNEENGIPLDLIELKHAGEKSLVLPVGTFLLKLTDQAGKSQTETIQVR